MQSSNASYLARTPNPFAQQDERADAYDYSKGSSQVALNTPPPADPSGDPMSAFYSEVSTVYSSVIKRCTAARLLILTEY